MTSLWTLKRAFLGSSSLFRLWTRSSVLSAPQQSTKGHQMAARFRYEIFFNWLNKAIATSMLLTQFSFETRIFHQSVDLAQTVCASSLKIIDHQMILNIELNDFFVGLSPRINNNPTYTQLIDHEIGP